MFSKDGGNSSSTLTRLGVSHSKMSSIYEAVQAKSCSPVTFALIFGILLAVLYRAYHWALPKPISGIPYDHDAARSIGGNLSQMLAHEKVHGRLRSWFVTQTRKHRAPLVQVWPAPFSKPILIISDYQESRDILLRRTKEFDRGQMGADIFHGVVPNHHIAMTSPDPRFKGNKEIVRDLMAPTFLNEISAPEIYSKTMTLIDFWALKATAAKGKPFDALRDIIDAALDIINAAAFASDASMSTLKHQLDYLETVDHSQLVDSSHGSIQFPRAADVPDIAAIYTITEHLGTQFRSMKPRLDHKIRLLTSPKLRRSIAQKDAMISREIDRSVARFRSGDNTMFSALDHVLQREMSAAQKTGRSPDFHSPRICDELFGYIIGGHETSSTSLAWTLKFIADHQEVQHKLRSALRDAYPAAFEESRQPSAMEITKTSVSYLDAVIEESLRCAAPLPIFARQTTVDTVILGHKVPKGTAVIFTGDGYGFKSPPLPVDDQLRSETSREKHRGGQWNTEDMHLFKPERWLKTDEKGNAVYDSQAGPSLAFGLGPRGCFGKRLAYLEMRMVLALLVWNFDFLPLDEPLKSYQAYDAITMVPKYCYVALKQLH
ncbi:cytochrome P450 [Xylariales sp. AK1849]|nr:cytochrome P450 [Xylariales sp. AK1849]